ncbi:hypothetical protein [Pseudogemmobacter humi]|uniref:Uncharacterized protein n=1 Tax=Pseudogemmobacter humi TaxID=2483812 RepID=A0A3P5WZ72_9RHOB|nr:hypothetical protein [Pseudogemmobacter humi]VDC27218.1 hypothetical protein XINFAN_01804 [Pseudogemmobacter humi]
MSEEAEWRFWRPGNPTLWGVLFSIALAGVTIWLARRDWCYSSDSGELICMVKWQAFLASSPNEVGDALAGFAGVLAFIWVAVTVALQSAQLRAQREELRLTRKEMEEQRKATQDMARSLAREAAIFEDEQLRRNQAESWAVVQELINTFRRRFPVDPEYRPIKWLVKGKDPRVLGYERGDTNLRDLRDDEFMSRALGAVRKHCHSQVMKAMRSGESMERTGDVLLAELHDLIRRMLGHTGQLAGARRIFLEACKLSEWDMVLTDLRSAGAPAGGGK